MEYPGTFCQQFYFQKVFIPLPLFVPLLAEIFRLLNIQYHDIEFVYVLRTNFFLKLITQYTEP